MHRLMGNKIRATIKTAFGDRLMSKVVRKLRISLSECLCMCVCVFAFNYVVQLYFLESFSIDQLNFLIMNLSMLTNHFILNHINYHLAKYMRICWSSVLFSILYRLHCT